MSNLGHSSEESNTLLAHSLSRDKEELSHQEDKDISQLTTSTQTRVANTIDADALHRLQERIASAKSMHALGVVIQTETIPFSYYEEALFKQTEILTNPSLNVPATSNFSHWPYSISKSSPLIRARVIEFFGKKIPEDRAMELVRIDYDSRVIMEALSAYKITELSHLEEVISSTRSDTVLEVLARGYCSFLDSRLIIAIANKTKSMDVLWNLIHCNHLKKEELLQISTAIGQMVSRLSLDWTYAKNKEEVVRLVDDIDEAHLLLWQIMWQTQESD